MNARTRSSSRRASSRMSRNDSDGIGGSASARYEVLERSGEGTLFVVYRVRDRQDNSYRALKALKGAYSRHAAFGKAFDASAQSTLSLRGSHLTARFELGREEDTHFLVEDWMPGGNLEKRISKAPLSSAEVARLGAQIASGLETMHKHGIFHGDLRPRQVLFDAEGHARLSDAGFYAAFASADMNLADVQPEAMQYCAPEICDGQPPCAATDLYSLGILLYRAITGRVPFDGPSPLSIAMRHRNDEPLRPSQFNPSCTSELETLILALLDKEPINRPQSASEVSQVLAPRRQRSQPSNRPAVAAEAVAGIAAGATAASTPPVAAAASPAISRNGTSTPRARRRGLGRSTPLANAKAAAVPTGNSITREWDQAAEERDSKFTRRKTVRREFWGAFLAFFWMIAAAALLFGIFYGAYTFWIREAPPNVTVPKYVGLNQTDAQIILQNAGLQMRIRKEVYNPKKPEGTVIGGDTKPEKIVKQGRLIMVDVSRGEAPVRMVDFSELSLNQARTIITRHGMRLGQVSEQYHDRVPKGYVCGQFPEAGESFRRSDPINLIISRGPQPSSVAPDQSALPSAPPEAAPSIGADTPSPQPNVSSEDTLISRSAAVRVYIPENGGPQEVRIVVRDSQGEYTAYQQTQEAGDVIDKTVQVVRSQGGTALIRIYVGGKLLKEIRV